MNTFKKEKSKLEFFQEECIRAKHRMSTKEYDNWYVRHSRWTPKFIWEGEEDEYPCAFCGVELFSTAIPVTDESWAKEGKNHAPDCRWIETRGCISGPEKPDLNEVQHKISNGEPVLIEWMNPALYYALYTEYSINAIYRIFDPLFLVPCSIFRNQDGWSNIIMLGRHFKV